MPLQLYCELVTLTDVVWRALGHGMSYYCQRLAGELARFRLVIDAKSNLNITPHEEWWRQCVKPLLQSLSIREPLPMLKSGDYSAFRRNFPSLAVPDYLREHVPSNLVSVGDLSGILREIEFDDSRQQVGLQIADALTNCVRRALIGNVQADGWRHVRKLMIRRRGGAVKFISMGSGGPIPRTTLRLGREDAGRRPPEHAHGKTAKVLGRPVVARRR